MTISPELHDRFANARQSYDAVIELLAQEVYAATNDGTVIAVLTGDGNALEVAGVCHPEPHTEAFLRDQAATGFFRVGKGLAGHVAETGRSLRVADMSDMYAAAQQSPNPEAAPMLRPFFDRHPHASLMIVPIVSGGDTVGIAAVTRIDGRPPHSDAELAAVVEVADLVADAIASFRRGSVLGAGALEALFATLSHGLLFTSADGKILAANPAACAILGVPETEICRRGVRAFVIDDQPELSRMSGDRAQTGHASGLIAVRRGDGTVFTAETASTTFVTELGDRRAIVWFRDITDRLEREATLREQSSTLALANVELQRSALLKDEFLANVSHELRAPLANVLAVTELLLDDGYGPLDGEQRAALTTVFRSNEHLLALVNDLLDVNRLEAGVLAVRPAPTTVNEVVGAAVRLVADRAAGRDQHLTVDDRTGAAPFVADQRRITQILVNLIDNAVKFTPDGGDIGVVVERVDPGSLRFEVWDTGPGIAAEHLDSVFEPFTQVDAALDRRHHGAGLGLAIAERLARLHQGTLTVESEVGRGTRFTLVVPVAGPTIAQVIESADNLDPTPGDRRPVATHTVATDLTAASGAPAPPGTPGRAARRVLLVEDSPDMGDVIRRHLTRHGHTVHWVTGGRAALADAASFAPHIAFVDVQMPDMDGLEAMRCLRRDPALARLRIVALTGLAMPGDRERCLTAGADDYVAKPASLHELLRLVDTVGDAGGVDPPSGRSQV